MPQKDMKNLTDISLRFIKPAEEAVNRLKERYQKELISVVLYGSVARGEEKETSDLDLFIVLKGPFRFVPKRREVYDLLSRITRDVVFSPMIMDEREVRKLQPIHFELYADGIILYDSGDFMRKILQRVGEIVNELGSTRYRTKDGCYGRILKKDMKKGEVIEVEL